MPMVPFMCCRCTTASPVSLLLECCDAVRTNAVIARDTAEVRVAAVAGLVSELWRCVLFVCNTLLARAAHEVLVQLLVRGMQVRRGLAMVRS